MARLILGLYNLLALLLIGPLCWYVCHHPNFAGTLRLRLSLKLPGPHEGDLIWFHGASLGEVKAAAGLIEALKARRPSVRICVSSMTATGREAASKIEAVDMILPMPFDLPWVMRRYFDRLKPKALVIVETEIWPNMLAQARVAGVKTLFVNARLTEQAFRRYRWVRPLMEHVLERAMILAISDADAGRFKALGAHVVEVFGNLKFDALQAVNPDRAGRIRATLGCGERPVFIAGSVREGEERCVMDAVIAARLKVPGLFAIIAPRHPQSTPILIDMAQAAGLAWGLRSKSSQAADLLIIDTMGELFDLYGASQAAFVGGSLVPLGGQNILEPLAWGVPTMHGPHMDNFLWAMDVVKDCTIVVENAAALGKAIGEVLASPEEYAPRSQAAREALEKAQGATARYADAILDKARAGGKRLHATEEEPAPLS